MPIQAEHVEMIRTALFGSAEQVSQQLQNVSDDDGRVFECLLVAALAELVERTLGRRPLDRADIVRLVASLRTGTWTELDPTSTEALLRLLYGDEAVLENHTAEDLVNPQLLVAYAFLERLQLQNHDEFIGAIRQRADQLAELAAM